jgi:Fic family protein
MQSDSGAMNQDRRDPIRRATFVQSVVTRLIQSPMAQFTVETVEQILDASPDTAHRMLDRLTSAGVLQELRGGLWVRTTSRPHFTPTSL